MAEPPDPSPAQPLARSRLAVSRYFAALKLPLLLFCILAALLGGYYVFYVSQQNSYLITRNFRLLATIGEHIEAAIRSDRTVLSNMRFGDQSLEDVRDEASKFIPIIQSAQIVKWPKGKLTAGAMALQFVERNTQIAWVLRDQMYDDAFVLSSFSRMEVAALEDDSSTSAWDAIRWPFLAVLVGSLAFLFVTQHELFNTTVGVVTAVAAAVPAIVKMANLFGERRAAG